MPRRDKRSIERTNNPYAPFSFMYGRRRVHFVPKFYLWRGARPRTRILDLGTTKSKRFTVWRRE